MTFQSKRLAQIPPYLFAKINQRKKELMAQGVDIIDLGIGDPDLPTPSHIVEKLREELNDPANFKYSPFQGISEFREAVASFYKQQYDVELDPETEVLTLIGSKEGIAHIIPALADEGDYILIPDPGYPVYRMAASLANVHTYGLPLTPSNHFQPEWDQIPEEMLQKAKLIFLNYPSNPTTATVDLSFFEEAVRFAKERHIPIAHDSAYHLITFDGYKAPSILQVEGAKEIAVELGSLSKTFNMTGWRIGYVVGNKEIIKLLSTYKSNVDSSQFIAIQKAAAYALQSDLACVERHNQIYKQRQLVMLEGLKNIGIDVKPPRGSIFIWAPVPKGYTSAEFASMVLEKTGVVITPGSAFGQYGEGYFRISLSVPDERLLEAAERIKRLL